MKYKIGDKVKIREDVCISTPCVIHNMLGLAGTEGTIIEVIRANRYRVASGEYVYIWPGEALEPIGTDVYKIFSNGPATICEKKDHTGKTVSKGIAKCCPGDTFNPDEGAVWALGRVVGFDLMEKVVKEYKEKEETLKVKRHKYKEGDFVIVTNPRSVYPAYVEFIKCRTPWLLSSFRSGVVSAPKSIFKVRGDGEHSEVPFKQLLIIEDIRMGGVYVIGKENVKPLDFHKLGALL